GASILCSPLVANRQPIIVGFAGGLAVHSEFANASRRAPLQFRLQAGVRNDQLSAVEYVVTDETINERNDLLLEFFGFGFELSEGFRQSMRYRHISASQLP